MDRPTIFFMVFYFLIFLIAGLASGRYEIFLFMILYPAIVFIKWMVDNAEDF